MGWDGMGWDGMGWDGMGWDAELASWMWPETRSATPTSAPDLLGELKQIPPHLSAHASVLSTRLPALPSKGPCTYTSTTE